MSFTRGEQGVFVDVPPSRRPILPAVGASVGMVVENERASE